MDTTVKPPFEICLDGAYYQWFWDYSLIPESVKVIILRSGIGKAPDVRFVENCKLAKDNGKKVGLYHWLNPWVETQDHLDVIKKQFELAPTDFACLDVEHAGQDTRNKIPPFYNSAKLSSKAYGVLQLIERQLGIPVVLYTRATFIWDFMRPSIGDVDGWINKYPQWIASYPAQPKNVTPITWDYLFGDVVPKTFSPYWYYVPEKFRNCKIWQFTGDRYTLPGITGKEKKPTAMDINVLSPDFFDVMKIKFDSVTEEIIPEELTDCQKLAKLWEFHPELH